MKYTKKRFILEVSVTIITFTLVAMFAMFIFSGCSKQTKSAKTSINTMTVTPFPMDSNPNPTSASVPANSPSVTKSAQSPEQSNASGITGSPVPAKEGALTSGSLPGTEKTTASSVTLLAVGDNLIHIEVVKSGKQSDGTYNFDSLYANLAPEISSADIAVINQETILGGKDFPYSGYPNFNSPTEIGDAVINAGFDVVLSATNHTMDMGVKGIENTLSYWKQHPEITVLGINDSAKAKKKIPIVEKNGIKIAMLNYTFSLNGHSIPKDKTYLVNMLDKASMKADIKKAEKEADFTIVFPHWGTEYVYEPTNMQKDLTEFFYDQGVDLVIGTHPHVLEPVEWITNETNKLNSKANSLVRNRKHRMLVYYSLGNFMSFQKEAPRMLGGIASVTITKDEKGTYISNAGITPIVTHYEINRAVNDFKIYKLSDYTKALANQHGVSKIATSGPLTYQGTYSLARQILGKWFVMK